jgi:16S rRNA (cytidine1402-2'-O)-methyltransferase
VGAGRLVLVATPLGNLADLSPRAADALRDAQGWLVEDTRVSGKLQQHLGIKKPMAVLNEHTQPGKLQKYLADLESGQTLALLTDGGTPAISDPGAALVDLCRDASVSVDALPGPSAPTLALALSGFFAQRFAFLGFLPRKPGPMKAELRLFSDSAYTLVVFESPYRLDHLLKAAHEALGERRYAICREMTKAFEQVYRGRLPHIPDEKAVPRKGEFTVVFEGRRKDRADADD